MTIILIFSDVTFIDGLFIGFYSYCIVFVFVFNMGDIYYKFSQVFQSFRQYKTTEEIKKYAYDVFPPCV